MTVLRCPDTVAPETRNVSGGEFSVGRGPGVDWVLPDPGAAAVQAPLRGGVPRRRLAARRHLDQRHVPQPRQRRRSAPATCATCATATGCGSAPTRSRCGWWRRSCPAGRAVGQQPVRRSVRHGSVRARPAAAQSVRRTGPSEPAHRAHVGAVAARFRSAGAGAARDAVPRSDPGGPFAGRCRMRFVRRSPGRPDAAAFGGVIPGDDLLPDDWDKDLLEGIAPPGGDTAASATAVAQQRRRKRRRRRASSHRSNREPRRTAQGRRRRAPAGQPAAERWRAARGLPRGRRPAGCAARRIRRRPCWRWARRSATWSPDCAPC